MQVIPILGGRYRLGPEIASGGMGAVHRAWDERFNREVAIKVLRSGADRVEQERLRREAQYLARLDHPNLVAVLDAGSDRLRSGDAVWFAMELVAGPDLRGLLKRDGPLDGPALRRVLTGLVAALGALHDAGLVHRDLKPANVLLTAEPWTGRWDVKLVDLGIAQHNRTEHLTSTGQIVGTAAYLSPEQVSGGAIGPATDVYALGLLALEALTGRIAFPGGPAESAAARLVRAPEPPPGLDESWRSVLTAMTALDPAGRPTVDLLARLVRDLPDETRSRAAAEVPTEAMTVVETTRLPAPAVAADAPTTVLAPEAVTTVLAHEPATTVLPQEHGDQVRPRRGGRPIRRRHLLVAASLLVVLGATGGWVAALSGGGGTTAEAVTTTPPAAVRTPTATPTLEAATPTAPPSPTSTPPATPAPAVVVDTAKVDAQARERARKAAEQTQQTLQRWRDRWKHHHHD